MTSNLTPQTFLLCLHLYYCDFMNVNNIKVIGLDADDTLWVNETFFRENESEFCDLLKEFGSQNEILDKLLTVEISNLELYGYGIKAFVLSMLETAIEISQGTVSNDTIRKIMLMGKKQLDMPVELLPNVESTLSWLQSKYKLVLVTKGDLLDQERKLNRSGLASYFHHIEIISDKKESDYQKIINHLDIRPEEFMMVGNSLKSDVLPPLAIGCFAVHIPFHTTWIHEQVDVTITEDTFFEAEKISDLATILASN